MRQLLGFKPSCTPAGTDKGCGVCWLRAGYKCAGWGESLHCSHSKRRLMNAGCVAGPTHHNPTNCSAASSACTCSHGYGVGAVKQLGNDVHAVSVLYANITARERANFSLVRQSGGN